MVFWPFLTYLPTYLVLLYNVPFSGLSWNPLSSLIWDVINERSQKAGDARGIYNGSTVKMWPITTVIRFAVQIVLL